MTQTTLAVRRADVEARYETTLREQGAAALDGLQADTAALLSVATDLTIIEAAEAVQARRQWEAAEKAAEERRDALRAQVAEAEAERLDAVQRAQSATDALVAALRDVNTTSDRLVSLARHLGKGAPDQLARWERQEVLSRAIAGELATIDAPARYGALKWYGAQRVKDWADSAHKAVKRDLQSLIGEGVTNG